VSRGESELLFRHLEGLQFTVRFHWEAGSVAIWENRMTAHLALQVEHLIAASHGRVIASGHGHRAMFRSVSTEPLDSDRRRSYRRDPFGNERRMSTPVRRLGA
jgi:hypothetical protein